MMNKTTKGIKRRSKVVRRVFPNQELVVRLLISLLIILIKSKPQKTGIEVKQ